MERNIASAYYAVIPADVRYDPELRPNAKLLYGEVTSLCDKTGYCWATNEYFSELYGLSVSTVSRLISQLEGRGYIRCEMAATAKGSERRIYAGVFVVKGGLSKNSKTPLDENSKGGLDENSKGGLALFVKQNNKEVSIIPPYNPPMGDEGYPVLKTPRKTRAKKSVPDHNPERFEQFWAAYPGGGSRMKAVAAWDALAPDDALIDIMARALKRQMKSKQWQEGIGIPHASTWLNGQRWTDKLPEVAPHPAEEYSGPTWADDPEVVT